MELFAILPYLKTSGTVTIRGIDFRSSTEVDSLARPTKQQAPTPLISRFSILWRTGGELSIALHHLAFCSPR